MCVARKQPRANDAVDEGEDKDGRDSQDARKEGHHTHKKINAWRAHRGVAEKARSPVTSGTCPCPCTCYMYMYMYMYNMYMCMCMYLLMLVLECRPSSSILQYSFDLREIITDSPPRAWLRRGLASVPTYTLTHRAGDVRRRAQARVRTRRAPLRARPLGHRRGQIRRPGILRLPNVEQRQRAAPRNHTRIPGPTLPQVLDGPSVAPRDARRLAARVHARVRAALGPPRLPRLEKECELA